MDNSLPNLDDLQTAINIMRGIVACAGVIKEIDLEIQFLKNTEMLAWKDYPIEASFVLRTMRANGDIKCFEYSYDEMPNRMAPRRVYAPKSAKIEVCKY